MGAAPAITSHVWLGARQANKAADTAAVDAGPGPALPRLAVLVEQRRQHPGQHTT